MACSHIISPSLNEGAISNAVVSQSFNTSLQDIRQNFSGTSSPRVSE